MPPTFNKYMLTKFIVDKAYNDHNKEHSQTKQYWEEWLRSLAKIFPHSHLPKGIINGLYAKNNKYLTSILNNYTTTLEEYIDIKIYKRNKEADNKFKSWQLKNEFNKHKQIKQKQIKQEEIKHKKDEEYHIYCESRREYWRSRLEEIQRERDSLNI